MKIVTILVGSAMIIVTTLIRAGFIVAGIGVMRVRSGERRLARLCGVRAAFSHYRFAGDKQTFPVLVSAPYRIAAKENIEANPGVF